MISRPSLKLLTRSTTLYQRVLVKQITPPVSCNPRRESQEKPHLPTGRLIDCHPLRLTKFQRRPRLCGDRPLHKLPSIQVQSHNLRIQLTTTSVIRFPSQEIDIPPVSCISLKDVNLCPELLDEMRNLPFGQWVRKIACARLSKVKRGDVLHGPRLVSHDQPLINGVNCGSAPVKLGQRHNPLALIRGAIQRLAILEFELPQCCPYPLAAASVSLQIYVSLPIGSAAMFTPWPQPSRCIEPRTFPEKSSWLIVKSPESRAEPSRRFTMNRRRLTLSKVNDCWTVLAAVFLFRQRSYDGLVRSNRGESGILAITHVRAVMIAKRETRMVAGGLDRFWLGQGPKRSLGSIRKSFKVG